MPLASGLVLRGYVDRLDEAPDGALRVVDYKTGRAPRDGFEQKAMFQMRFYALALWRLRGVIPRRLQLLYLGSGETVTLDPDEADLLAMERKLEALWTAIERAHATGDWRPSPSRLCDWCDHRALCPAWGGTPPPLPSDADPAVTAADAVGGGRRRGMTVLVRVTRRRRRRSSVVHVHADPGARLTPRRVPQPALTTSRRSTARATLRWSPSTR